MTFKELKGLLVRHMEGKNPLTHAEILSVINYSINRTEKLITDRDPPPPKGWVD